MSPECSSGRLWTQAPQEGSLLDADHPGGGVLIARRSTPMAFAVWQGGDGQRDGNKLVSDGWILLDMGEG